MSTKQRRPMRSSWITYPAVMMILIGNAGTATTVRLSGSQLLLTDGPYVETKEHLLGFYLIDVPNLDAAIEWASRMPVLRRGAVEIRPLLPSSETSILVGRGMRPSTD
jgi:hypothetical protein